MREETRFCGITQGHTVCNGNCCVCEVQKEYEYSMETQEYQCEVCGFRYMATREDVENGYQHCKA